MTHTPGPWTVTGKVYVSDCLGQSVARAITMDGSSVKQHCINEDQARANARLIAAAPEMLEALYTAMNLDFIGTKWIEGLDAKYHFDKIRHAINKAEGKEPLP